MNRSSDILEWIKGPFSARNWGNWKVIILCVVGAAIFWFFNALNKDYTTSISYPVQFTFDQDLYIATEPAPDEIQINVSGGGWNLIRRTGLFNTPPILINIPNPMESRKIPGTSLRATISDQLTEFRLNFVVTDTVALSITNRIQEKFPVIIDSLNINLREDYRIISEITQAIDSVLLDGPDVTIDELPDTIVIIPPERGIDEDYDEDIQINLPSPLISVIPNKIKVGFKVARFIRVTRSYPITTVNFPPDSSLILESPSTTLSFTIQDGLEDELSNEDFSIVADLERMVPFDSTIQPLIKKHPAHVSEINIESGRVKVLQ